MKSLFLLLVFTSLFLISCAQVDPIVESVCDITQEICYYADLVCENWHPQLNNVNTNASQIETLKLCSNQLQSLGLFVKGMPSGTQLKNSDNIKLELIDIRNKLKQIATEQMKIP